MPAGLAEGRISQPLSPRASAISSRKSASSSMTAMRAANTLLQLNTMEPSYQDFFSCQSLTGAAREGYAVPSYSDAYLSNREDPGAMCSRVRGAGWQQCLAQI